jgi:hypothetical protein
MCFTHTAMFKENLLGIGWTVGFYPVLAIASTPSRAGADQIVGDVTLVMSARLSPEDGAVVIAALVAARKAIAAPPPL